MAGLGRTKLEACNQMLLAVGQMRVSALDNGGSSDVAEAEYFLDMVIEECICEGHPSTTKIATLTASAGGVIDLSSASALALKVRGTGKFRHRSLSIRGVEIYDEDFGTSACFGNAESVTVEIYEAASASSPADFEDLAPDLKHKIMHRAVQYYRARKRPDPLMDSLLMRDSQRTENAADQPWAREHPGFPGPVQNNTIQQAPAVQTPPRS